MATLARRMPPRGGAMLAGAAVLIAAAILAIGYVALSVLRGAAGGNATAAPAQGGLAGVAAVAGPALATPVDLARFHATAEAGLNRPPEQRQAVPATPTPPPAPTSPPAATKPAAPAKPAAPSDAAGPGAPAPAAGPAGTPTPSRTPRPTVTVAPTRTPTITATATPTDTATPSPTETPLPAPCEVTIPVPRVFTGNGYYVTVTHEFAGPMTVHWSVAGGEVRAYEGKPSLLGPDRSGIAEGVPAEVPVKQGLSGPRPINVGDRGPADYTFYFFNGSPLGIGPKDAQITYWTYGHCP
jgi:outer membrane biosynthesis protein TonB